MSEDLFKKKIKSWIECDNYILECSEKIKQINEKSKPVKKKKEELTVEITKFMSTNNISDNIINISDGDIRYNEYISQNPITLKHLKNLLDNYFTSSEESTKLYNYIKENREYKKITDLKRKINT